MTSFPELLRQLIGLSTDAKLVNRSGFYDARFSFGALVPALATETFTIVGVDSRRGL